MELVLGEGGFVLAPPEYVAALAAPVPEHGILFVADEIQTGFGPHRAPVRHASTTVSSPTSSPSPSRWAAGCRSPPSPAAPR